MGKKLIYNAIQTPDGTVLVSYHRHDYKTHLDKNKETYMIDGGLDYIRTNINKEPAKSLAVYDDAPFEVIRENVFRGSRGKDGKSELKYIKLSDIDDEYLESLIAYEELHRPSNMYLKYYKMEKEWRELK